MIRYGARHPELRTSFQRRDASQQERMLVRLWLAIHRQAPLPLRFGRTFPQVEGLMLGHVETGAVYGTRRRNVRRTLPSLRRARSAAARVDTTHPASAICSSHGLFHYRSKQRAANRQPYDAARQPLISEYDLRNRALVSDFSILSEQQARADDFKVLLGLKQVAREWLCPRGQTEPRLLGSEQAEQISSVTHEYVMAKDGAKICALQLRSLDTSSDGWCCRLKEAAGWSEESRNG